MARQINDNSVGVRIQWEDEEELALKRAIEESKKEAERAGI